MTCAAGAARTPRGAADLQRIHQRIEALVEQLVDLGHDAAKFGAVEVALHHVHHILHEQVALHLHDGCRGRPHEEHHEIVARFGVGGFLFLVELGVVEGDLDGGAFLRKFIEAHAHLVQRLAEVLVPRHRPAQLQQVPRGIELDAGLFFVGTVGAIGQRAGTGVFPKRLERVLDLRKGHVSAQGYFTMDMDFKRGVVA